jgi:hypothetical protein
MKKPLFTKLSSLNVGEQFFFVDTSLPDGVNDLTCYRKTKSGYINGVTRKITITSLDADVVDWGSFIVWKEERKEKALANFRSHKPTGKITKAGQVLCGGRWTAFGTSCSKNPVDYVHLSRPGGEYYVISSGRFNGSAKTPGIDF